MAMKKRAEGWLPSVVGIIAVFAMALAYLCSQPEFQEVTPPPSLLSD